MIRMRLDSNYSLLVIVLSFWWTERNASAFSPRFPFGPTTARRWPRSYTQRKETDQYPILSDLECRTRIWSLSSKTNSRGDDDEDTSPSEATNSSDATTTTAQQLATADFLVDYFEDNDFPAWIEGLKQWPLRPQSPSPTEDASLGETPDVGASSSFRTQDILSPLSRLIDMEALLNAGRSVVSSSAEETELKQDVASLENLEALSGSWDQWMGALKRGVSDITASANSTAFSKSAEGLLKQASARIDSLISEASEAMSPNTIQTLILRASEALQNKTVANELVDIAQQMALDRGLDVSDAARQAKETTAYAFDLVTVADAVLRKGYVAGDPMTETTRDFLQDADVPPVVGSRALFSDFQTVSELNQYRPALAKAAEMGALAGAVYEDTVPRTRALDHTLVARGYTEDIEWMVTDHVADASDFKDDNIVSSGEPIFVRTITIRGFDASDEQVDRERVLNRICSAVPEKVSMDQPVLLHSGLNDIAKSVYRDVKQYIDWMAPTHRLVLNGHSVGGSIAKLILFLLVRERTAPWVRRRVQRVYTFGSPPIARLDNKGSKTSYLDSLVRKDTCGVLEAFDLPSTMVQSFVQPWDPIVRLFSAIDTLYPLADDIGEDGVSLFASGPPRTLRSIIKVLVEAWAGWPLFRDNFKEKARHHYWSVGVQHLLLPEPTRYLADRFVSVNVAVPPVATVLRLSPRELHSVLEKTFPLDVFELSFMPQGIRGFVHHFYPAYGLPFVQYAKMVEEKSKGLATRPPASRDEDTEEKTDQFVDFSQWPPGYEESSSS